MRAAEPAPPASVACQECGEDVNPAMTRCKHCGGRIHAMRERRELWWWAVPVIALLLVVAVVVNVQLGERRAKKEVHKTELCVQAGGSAARCSTP